MVKALGRVVAVGFVLGIGIWLVLVLVAGYQLNELGRDGEVTVGAEAVPFAVATRLDGGRTLSVAPAGYALALAPVAVGLAVVALRRRATPTPADEPEVARSEASV